MLYPEGYSREVQNGSHQQYFAVGLHLCGSSGALQVRPGRYLVKDFLSAEDKWQFTYVMHHITQCMVYGRMAAFHMDGDELVFVFTVPSCDLSMDGVMLCL